MALYIRDIPVLTGEAARDFERKLEENNERARHSHSGKSENPKRLQIEAMLERSRNYLALTH